MPTVQPVFGEFFFVLLRGVEHHFDDAFHVAVGGRQRSHFHSEAARDRGPYLILVEDFAFDLAGLEYVFCQGLEDGFLAERKTERLHTANEAALAMPDSCKLLGKAALIPLEFGPIRQFMDIFGHSPHLLRRL
jgi:hypothetical protein